jgi:hypothetical protein
LAISLLREAATPLGQLLQALFQRGQTIGVAISGRICELEASDGLFGQLIGDQFPNQSSPPLVAPQ